MVEQRADDRGDATTRLGIDLTERVHESAPVDRSDQFALRVARLVETGVVVGADLDVKREPRQVVVSGTMTTKGKSAPNVDGGPMTSAGRSAAGSQG